jgi:large subunit ribosomal protein L32
MANPKQRRSKSNTRSRRANWKTSAPELSSCPQCKHTRRPHFACGNCGFYDGRQAVAAKGAAPAAKSPPQTPS